MVELVILGALDNNIISGAVTYIKVKNFKVLDSRTRVNKERSIKCDRG